jgi:hypothetical protein
VQKTRPAKIAITPLVVTTYESYFLFIFSIFLWLRLDFQREIDDNTYIRNNHTTKVMTMKTLEYNGKTYTGKTDFAIAQQIAWDKENDKIVKARYNRRPYRGQKCYEHENKIHN